MYKKNEKKTHFPNCELPEGRALVAGVPRDGGWPGAAADVGGVGGELLTLTEHHRHLVRHNCRNHNQMVPFRSAFFKINVDYVNFLKGK